MPTGLDRHLPDCTEGSPLIAYLEFKAKQRREDTQNAVQADLPGELRQLGRILQDVLQNVDCELDGLHRSLRLQEEKSKHSAESRAGKGQKRKSHVDTLIVFFGLVFQM